MRYEVFTLGKHFLHIHTSKGFTLFANAKLTDNGEVVSYTDTMSRRGGSWIIDCYKFLTVKDFPNNPVYCAVFGFDDNDEQVQVTATDIDVESISGVNGQLVDIGNISLPVGQALPVREMDALENIFIKAEKKDGLWNIPDLTGFAISKMEGFLELDYRNTRAINVRVIDFNFFNMKQGAIDSQGNASTPTDIVLVKLVENGFQINVNSSRPSFFEHTITYDEMLIHGNYGFRMIVTNGNLSYTILFAK